ncbi:hypothetical protein PUN28_004464 [Cardiocondyla obscurior]|uniref:Uncharacterized protein n=1 Tax=Cardiocondyla obscurior TaxID=286306 RepID=A0AAW2GFY9_9HYME
MRYNSICTIRALYISFPRFSLSSRSIVGGKKGVAFILCNKSTQNNTKDCCTFAVSERKPLNCVISFDVSLVRIFLSNVLSANKMHIRVITPYCIGIVRYISN